jgi:hypothetical protein
VPGFLWLEVLTDADDPEQASELLCADAELTHELTGVPWRA